jgi:hypothetical protein
MLIYDSGFEPDIIPAAMLAHRIMGIMAHWREYTGMSDIFRYCLSGLLADRVQSIGANFSDLFICIRDTLSRRWIP